MFFFLSSFQLQLAETWVRIEQRCTGDFYCSGVPPPAPLGGRSARAWRAAWFCRSPLQRVDALPARGQHWMSLNGCQTSQLCEKHVCGACGGTTACSRPFPERLEQGFGPDATRSDLSGPARTNSGAAAGSVPGHSRAQMPPARGARVSTGSFKPGRDSGGRESCTPRAEQPAGRGETRPTPLGNGELGGAELRADPRRFPWRRGPSRMEKGTGGDLWH